MAERARIKLSSPSYDQVSDIAAKIIDIAEKAGTKHSGAIPLPTKKLTVPTRKAPCGGGTETYEKWQMRIHKRIIDIAPDVRTLHRVMRIDIPENVRMEIDLKS
ncbi:MAG: 30S ribosomal protein S10 [Candidatus Diapherotrites archaeon]|uniref:Small ribosomal subunit protein uS10 n=1 Tax=Candidatus Iainarchaeum sp. TaxID=3101447 RepID=A0A8T4LFM0_9ARCH|nr:30S ribosomal protein S10 [Candidatus Diapherotrites archaeon]